MKNNIFILMVCFSFLMGYSSCNKEELNSNEITVTAFDQYLEFANDMESEITVRSGKSYTINEAVLNIEGGINVKYARAYPNVTNEKVYNGILPLNGKSIFDSEEIKVLYNSILKTIADYYYDLDCTECTVLSLDVEFDHETQSLFYDMFVGEKLNEVRGPNSRHVFASSVNYGFHVNSCNNNEPYTAAQQLQFKANHNLRIGSENGTFTNIVNLYSDFENFFIGGDVGCAPYFNSEGIYGDYLLLDGPVPNVWCMDGDYLNSQLDLIEPFAVFMESCENKDFQRLSNLYMDYVTGANPFSHRMFGEAYYGDFHPTNTGPAPLPLF